MTMNAPINSAKFFTFAGQHHKEDSPCFPCCHSICLYPDPVVTSDPVLTQLPTDQRNILIIYGRCFLHLTFTIRGNLDHKRNPCGIRDKKVLVQKKRLQIKYSVPKFIGLFTTCIVILGDTHGVKPFTVPILLVLYSRLMHSWFQLDFIKQGIHMHASVYAYLEKNVHSKKSMLNIEKNLFF